MRNDILRRIVGTQTYQPNWTGPWLWNGNEMLYYYPNSIGVKIGWTEQANFTIVAAAARDGRELYVAIMDTQNQYLESKRLLDWAFANTRNAC
jgi:D-alanyl-D-alanine carboxypeptidase